MFILYFCHYCPLLVAAPSQSTGCFAANVSRCYGCFSEVASINRRPQFQQELLEIFSSCATLLFSIVPVRSRECCACCQSQLDFILWLIAEDVCACDVHEHVLCSMLKQKYSKKEKTYFKLHFTLRFLLVRGWCWKIPNSSSLEAPKHQYYYPTNRSLKYLILKFCSPSGSTQMLIPASKNLVCACQPRQTPARKLFSFLVRTFWIWNIQSFFLFAVTHTCLHTVMAWLDTVCRPRGTTDHSLHTAASSGSTCGTTRKKTWRYLKHTNERMNVHNICHHTSLCL